MPIVIFSYISRDIVHTEFDGKKVQKIGGKAYYSGVCSANLGESTTIFIRTDNTSDDLLQQVGIENLTIYNFPVESTLVYENTFPEESLNTRIFKAKNHDNFKFDPKSLDDEMRTTLQQCSQILLSPASPDELSLEFVTFLKRNYNAKLSADLDFIIKRVNHQGKVFPTKKEKVNAILEKLDVVLLSSEDLDYFGCPEKDCLKLIASYGPSEIVLTKGSQGALIYDKQKDLFYDIPAVIPKQLIDTTGAGDTFIAAYLFYRQNHSVEKSGNFAAKITSKKIELPSAFTRKEN